jgi:LacI family transcriptional regulator
MATIYEVSALAGVSLSSVSRVLNDHEHVSEKTKKKVMAAMAELEYRPNSVARSLASSRSDSIGVLVSELHGPFFGDMLSSIELALRNAGKHAVITAGHSDEESEKKGLDFLIDRNCDALILLVDAMSDDDLIKLSRNKIPFVILNRNIPEIRENCLYLDNELGGYLAAKHLIECGHKDIAYISGPLSKQDSTERLMGHKRALIEAKISFNKALFYEGDYLTQSGRDGINDFIENKVLFTAVACANDEMASGAMRGARDNNIDIPSDCSIIGFDNAYFTEYLFPQLSTINNPIKAMAKMSTQWILKNVYKQKDLDIKNLFSPKLIKRESVVKVLTGIKK